MAYFCFDGLLCIQCRSQRFFSLRYRFLKVELKRHHWRRFIESDNPVAAALLAIMAYNKAEARDVRFAYLRMILRLRTKLDDARMALIMSVADLYFDPKQETDEALLRELHEQYPEEGVADMELMPAWKRWGYEKGIEEGLKKGEEKAKQMFIRKMLAKGFTPEQVAETIEVPLEEVTKAISE